MAKPRTCPIATYVHDDEAKSIKRAAEADERTVASFVRLAVLRYIETQNGERDVVRQVAHD